MSVETELEGYRVLADQQVALREREELTSCYLDAEVSVWNAYQARQAAGTEEDVARADGFIALSEFVASAIGEKLWNANHRVNVAKAYMENRIRTAG